MSGVPPEEVPAEECVDGLEVLWTRVVAEWDHAKAHEAFLAYSVANKQLAEAASRYRAFRDDVEKGDRARKQLDKIVLSATQLMLESKTPRPSKAPWSIFLSALATCAFLLLLLAYALSRK